MNSFERGGNVLEKLDIGGYSFETLKAGAILESKRWFGVARSTGNLGGYTSSSVKIGRGQYLLITNIEKETNNNKKTISFAKYGKLDWAKEALEKFKENGWINTFGTKGFIHNITKIKFDYRLKIIKSGFNES